MKSFWIGASVALLCWVIAVSGSDFIVNTTTQSVTDNYMDGGAAYWYRLNGGTLEYKTGGTSWQSPPRLPYPGCGFKNIAANNNRLLGLTTSNELFLANIKQDRSQWVMDLLDIAISLGDFSHPILVALGVYTEGMGYRLDTEYYATPWHWATAYQQHIQTNHEAWAWAQIGRDGNGLVNFNQIQDIAVGNWKGTVTTVYVLDAATRRISYIDEEPMMLEWELVKGSDTLPGLTADSRIDADHSVICVTAPNRIYWVRFDFHQPDRLPLLFLNWTELAYDPLFNNSSEYPGWHHIGNPAGQCDGFRVDVRCADGTAWPIPKAFGIGYISTNYAGIFGLNPINPPWTYPVRLTMKHATGTDNYFRMRLRHAKEMDTMPADVLLDGDRPFAFAVPVEDHHYFGTRSYSDPNDYLSPLGVDCYIHGKTKIIISNNITVNPAPGATFRAVIIP